MYRSVLRDVALIKYSIPSSVLHIMVLVLAPVIAR